MKVKFHINYHTDWGQSVYLYGTLPQLGDNEATRALEMEMNGPDLWSLELELPDDTPDFEYHFVVKAQDQAWRFEWGKAHNFRKGNNISLYNIFDSWLGEPSEKPYYSSAIVEGIFSRKHRDMPLPTIANSVQFRILAPMVAPDEVLAVSGELDVLGNWDPEKALVLNDANYPLWEGNVPMAGSSRAFEYKFLILDKETRQPRLWEDMNNRFFNIKPESHSEVIVIDGLTFANPRHDWRASGTAIPVFSIRTEEDFGVGDFEDIKKMVDWCKLTGQRMLQVLPINDTTKTGTWVDSYPYSANSTFALHPMYIRLEEVGEPVSAERRDYYESKRRELNSLSQIDYEAVNAVKQEYLREVFARDRKKTEKSDEYIRFVERNRSWLESYAVWCTLRDQYSTPDNTLWGDMSEYDSAKVDAYVKEHKDEIAYVYFVQYHLDRQLRGVRDYAHSNGVVLKGDIPIGIGRFSVDAWQYTRLFNMDCQAGAPPDDFSVLGQNWGFPTYNWDEMAKDGFAWWKARFRKMAEYFDAYRIDHILGFFRIWQIPMDAVHGLLGYFNPALPFSPEELRNSYDFWINPDLQARPLILEWMLSDFFGEYTEEAREKFLDHLADGRYHLKPFVNTQIKVREYFATQEASEKNQRLENALLGIIDDVLFIEDPYHKGYYHPRISAQYTYQFRILTDYEKWCFNRLYNDFFYHRHNDFWYGKAMWKLPPLLDSNGMLTCGEDLGMIPDCVPEVMRRLQILSLEIQRMPKDPTTEFGDTWHYPYQSVCTTSTHDMSGIRGWWESDPGVSQRYFNHVLHEQGAAPFFAEPWICSKIVDLQLKSPSMLCVLPLQDWLSMDGNLRRENPADEQINEPANPTHYWRYRMHLTVGELMNAHEFNATVREMNHNSGR